MNYRVRSIDRQRFPKRERRKRESERRWTFLVTRIFVFALRLKLLRVKIIIRLRVTNLIRFFFLPLLFSKFTRNQIHIDSFANIYRCVHRLGSSRFLSFYRSMYHTHCITREIHPTYPCFLVLAIRQS